MSGYLRTLAWGGLGALVGLLLFGFRPVAYALPEYATRTGEPCATCHVNPAGGGARTVRGSLWVAAGKPDTVPPLPGAEATASGGAAGATGGAPAAGPALYAQFGCAGCHGGRGEGGAGPALNGHEWSAARVSDIIRNGRGNMLALKAGTLSDADLAGLVTYVQAIGRGEVAAGAQIGPRAMAPVQALCFAAGTTPAVGSCGGN
jgi:mono/diheme cytochrome c family protein